MNKRILTLIGIAIVFSIFSSCAPAEVNFDEVEQMLLVDRGVVAGTNLGDSWESVSENCSPLWKPVVREVEGMDGNENYYELRKQYDDDNQVHVAFYLDEDKNISSISAQVIVTGKNRVEARKFMFKAFEFFNSKFKTSGENSWEVAIKNGEKPAKLTCTTSTYEGDEIKDDVTISLTKSNY